MRVASLCLVALLAAPSARAEPATITIPLRLNNAPDSEHPSAHSIGALASRLVLSSNFNSYTRPDVIGKSFPEIQARYREVAAGNNLVITYASPVQFHTVGGDLWVFEIVIGLGRPDRVDALFTIDNSGRVVEHEKYSGELAVELRRAAAAALAAD